MCGKHTCLHYAHAVPRCRKDIQLKSLMMHAQRINTTTLRTVCPTCGSTKKNGKLTYCGTGGSWQGKCGNNRKKFEHTWTDGVKACAKAVLSKAGEFCRCLPICVRFGIFTVVAAIFYYRMFFCI